MDRIDAMTTLIAAVDGGSLSAASRRLGMPLATVSRKVSELEAHLRTQILVRTSRHLLLTEAGRAYVDACRRILEEIEAAERAASGEYLAPRGHLTVTSSINFGKLHVEPVVLEFLKAYPEITVRLHLADSVVNLVDDHLDVAVRVGKLPDSNLIATRVGEVRWVSCASPEYLARRGTPDALEDLADHDCIMFERYYTGNIWSFGQNSTEVSVPVRSRLAVNTADAAISAAMAGAGITRLLSYQVASAVASGELRLILRAFEPEPMPVHLIYPAHSLLPQKLRAFLDFAAPRLKMSIAASQPAEPSAPL